MPLGLSPTVLYLKYQQAHTILESSTVLNPLLYIPDTLTLVS